MAADNLSEEDKEFLAKMEEELKDRYTEKDEEFMKIFNMEPSMPPIIENWWVSNNSGRRNNRYNPYRHGNRDNRDRGNQGDRRDGNRGYSDYNRGYNDYDDNNRHDNRYRRQRY